MIMFNALRLLFKISNVLAIILLIFSCGLTIAAQKRKSSISTADIVYPVFVEQHSMIKYYYWIGTLFIVLAWLLCSASVLETDANLVPSAILSKDLLTFGIVWAVAFFISIIVEIILKFFKNPSTIYSVMGGIKSSIRYSILYFILSFLIA